MRWLRSLRPKTSDDVDGRSSEAGDTLIEVLLAITILGITGVALLTGFVTSITASAEHRNLATQNTSLRVATDQVTSFLEHDSSTAFTCPNPYYPPWNPQSAMNGSWQTAYNANNSTFTISSYSVQYWNGTAFSSSGTCSATTPQLWTIAVTSGGATSSVSTVIYNTGAQPSTAGSCTNAPCQLVFLQVPTSGVLNGNVSPQPIVAIEDSNGNIVSGDVSSISLKIYSYVGSASSPSLSSNCSGVENNGVVPFGDCSLNALGNYELQAVDSNSSVKSAQMTSYFTVTSAPPAKLALSAAQGVASNTANIGITVSEEDAYGGVTTATSPVTVNLGSSSSQGIFATTSGGTSVTSVTIPAGSSSVTFYYGDTVAGNPTLTASTPGLVTATQAETVNAGPTTGFVVGTPTSPQTAGSPFTVSISAVDQYNNVVTNFGGGSGVCLVFSGPSNSQSANAPSYPSRGSCSNGQSSVTFSNGVASASVTLYDAQTTALTVAQASNPSIKATTGNVTVNSAVAKTLTVANPGTQNVGAAFNITLSASDQYGNPESGAQAITFSGPSNSPAPASNAPQYPSSVTFTGGSGTANITLYDAQATTLTAATSLGTGTSSSFTVKTGSLATFSLPTPGTQNAGTGFNESITAVDAYDNAVTGYTGSQVITFSGPGQSPAPSSRAPAYPPSVSFANGVGTASITLYDAQSTQLTATQGTISGSTGSFTVSSRGATVLSIPTTPGGQTAGTGFNVTIGATDTYSNPYSGSLTPSFSGPANSPAPVNKTPSYPSALTFTNGSATASVILYDAQTTTLTVSASGATPATSGTFAVAPAPENMLTIGTQPVSITAGGTVGLGVTLKDQYGNQITTGNAGSTDTIGVTLNTGTFAGGTTSVAASNGVATFTNLQITQAGSFTITATDSTNSVTAATSSLFTVSPSTENKLLVTTQPPGSVAAGTAFGTTITVADQYGNAITTGTGSTDTVKLTLSSGSFAGGTTSVSAANGVASFSGLQITAAGNYTITASDTTKSTVSPVTTTSVAVSAGTPTKLVITGQPASTLIAGQTVSVGVTIEDQYNNVVTTGTGSNDNVSVALSSGSFASGTTTVAATNGVASFSGLQITKAGSLTITASDTSRSGVSTATTNQISVGAAAENKLSVTSQPVGGTAGGTISLGIAVVDQYGNTVTSGTGSTDTVKATLSSGNFASGTTSIAASGGLANYSNLVIDTAGNYTIAVSDTTNTGVTSTTTSSFLVGPSTASKLVFTTQPSNATGGSAFPTQPAVTVEDQYGNPVMTNSSTATLSIASGTPASGGPGTLSGCSQTEAIGVISFTGCSINTTGTGYALKATDGSLSAATSGVFSVTNGPAAQFALTAPSSPKAGTSFTVTVTAEDAGGNTATSYTGAQCLTFTGLGNSPTNVTPTYPAQGSCGSGSQVTFASGTATGANAPAFVPADAQTTSLAVTGSGLSGTSPSFTVGAGSAAHISTTSGAGQTSNVGSSFSSPLVATVTDADGNNVANALVTFTSPASGDGTFASSGCVSNSPTTVCTVDTGSTGQATSSTFTAGGTTGGYNVTASVGSPVTSTTFAETNRMTATNVASASGGAVNSITSSTFGTTSGSTYLVTAYETSNRTSAPGTPTLSLPGSASSTLVATNTFSNSANCHDDNYCYQWAWWFNATSSSGSASVGVTFANGTPSGSVVDVVALAGNSTSTPIVSGSTTTASGCAHTGCSPKTDTVTANTANAPATNDITLQILASDETMGSAPTWSPATTNLYFRSATDSSLDVGVAIPGVQNESTSAAPFGGNDDWGTIALEVEAN